jgi:hypothetical protein
MKTPKLFVLGSIPLLALLMTDAVYGDVTVERFFKTSGFGGMGASESSQVTQISGIKKREKDAMKMTGSFGKLVTKMAGEMESDSITDINKDAIWALDHKKKTYTEQKISAAKEAMAKAKEESQPTQKPAAKEEPAQKEEPKVKVIRNEFSVKATGEKKNINGFECTQYVLTWLVETEDLETKGRAKNIMTTELWNTSETKEIKQLQSEENAFNLAYLKKLGLEMSAQEIQQFGLAMMGGMLGGDEKTMEKNAKALKEKLSQIKGYNIATSVKWEHESDQMKKQQAEEAKVEEEEEESEDTDVSSGLGGIMSGLAKKAMKDKMKEKEKAKEAEKKGKENVVFDSYLEIKKISTGSIPQTEFEIPAGYKLVKQ